ncbi:hypothetical protein JJE00_05420 [Candidatus Bathyarchaeota archaeon]|nr:hypothetical protein [Candidatus Bathyarchaeota archaeon]
MKGKQQLELKNHNNWNTSNKLCVNCFVCLTNSIFCFKLAIVFGVPAILVGAKLVAIGTSLPELTLDITAVRRGRVQLALGDVIGSHLTNLTLVLGIILLGSPFQVDMTIFIEIISFLLITSILFWRFVMRGGISKIEGSILMLSNIVFLIFVV